MLCAFYSIGLAQTAEYFVTKKPIYTNAPWELELRVYHDNKLDQIPEYFPLPDQADDWEHLELLSSKKIDNGDYYTIQKLRGFTKTGLRKIRTPSATVTVMLKGEKKASNNPLIKEIYGKPKPYKLKVKEREISVNLTTVENILFGNVNITTSTSEVIHQGVPFDFSVSFLGDVDQNRIKKPRLKLENVEIYSVNKITKSNAITFIYQLNLKEQRRDGRIELPNYLSLGKNNTIKTPLVAVISTSAIAPELVSSKTFYRSKTNHLFSLDFWMLISSVLGFILFLYLLRSKLIDLRTGLKYWIKKVSLKTEVYLFGKPNMAKLMKYISLNSNSEIILTFFKSKYGGGQKFTKNEYLNLIESLNFSTNDNTDAANETHT